MKITGLVLWVSENRLSEKFYRKLGFEVTESTDRHSVIRLDGFEIMLINMRDEEKFANDAMVGHKGKGMYVYIRADNVDALHGQLKESGLVPATEPTDWDWGNREFILKDPDGYKLCFWQPIQ